MKSVERSVALVLPGLLDLPAADCKDALDTLGRYPLLERALARGAQKSFGRAGMEAVLFELFDVALAADRDLPVAAASYQADADHAAEGWVMRADPVHLIPDRDQLVLVGPDALRLSLAEAERLAKELSDLFAEDGWRFEALTPTRWYLHLPTPPNLRTYELSTVHGRAISRYLPAGVEAKAWHRIMNEVQMALHASAVNRDRLALGQLTVSSLWFWGGGKLTGLGHSRYSQIWSDEPVSLGLGQLSCTPRQAMPGQAMDLLGDNMLPGWHLIVMDELRNAWLQGERSVWQQVAKWVVSQWLEPLLKAVKDRRLSRLVLYSCDGRQFEITPARLRCWWCRAKPLSHYCEQ